MMRRRRRRRRRMMRMMMWPVPWLTPGNQRSVASSADLDGVQEDEGRRGRQLSWIIAIIIIIVIVIVTTIIFIFIPDWLIRVSFLTWQFFGSFTEVIRVARIAFFLLHQVTINEFLFQYPMSNKKISSMKWKPFSLQGFPPAPLVKPAAPSSCGKGKGN